MSNFVAQSVSRLFLQIRNIIRKAFPRLAKLTQNALDFSDLSGGFAQLSLQVKAITKIAAHQPGNARKLSQVLTVAAKNGTDGGKRALNVIMTHGQNGMDTLYAALRKGPKGLKFIADHPALAARGLKNIRKGAVWGAHEWSNFARNSAALATLIKGIVLATLTAMLCWLLVPTWVLQRVMPSKASASKPGSTASSSTRSHPFARLVSSPIGFATGAGCLVFLLILLQSGLGSGASASSVHLGNYEGPAAGGDPATSPILSAFMVVLTLGVQLAIWIFVRNKLADIDRPGDSCRLQLKRLENLDTFLDLPLYAGLALTVCSFLLITYNPGVSRLLAYTSTIIGILAAVSLRVSIVHPVKERLVKQAEAELS